jgi:gamma-glutamyl hydrolase
MLGVPIRPPPPHPLYSQTASFIFNSTIAANSKGVYFPLWGTCQGFQLLCILAAGTDVLEHNAFDSEDYSIPLNLTAEGLVSRLFGPMPLDVVQTLVKENVTTNLHHDGVTPDTFAAKVSPLFTALSTNVDRTGKAFVSTMEAKRYPIWGTQWVRGGGRGLGGDWPIVLH